MEQILLDASDRPTRSHNPSSALLDPHPRDRPGNHELLDLFGALEYVVGHFVVSMAWRAVPLSWVFSPRRYTPRPRIRPYSRAF